jgi:hypothetical protein
VCQALLALLLIAGDLHMIEGDTIDAETGRAVDGVDLEVTGPRVLRVKSNVGHPGGVQISQLPAGRYTLVFSHDGYERKRMVIDVPREAKLGPILLQPKPRTANCPESKVAPADEADLPIIAAAIRFVTSAQREWWKNPDRIEGFDFPTELLLLDETLAVPFDDLSLGRVKTLRGKPLWRVFRERATLRRSIRALGAPERIRLVCDIDETAPPFALIRRYPKASLAISASVPAVLDDEALVYVVAHYYEEGFVVYLQRAEGVWKARWHVQVAPSGC